MTDCPTRDRLDLWVSEKLDAAEQVAVTAHVNGCPRCQAVLDDLTDDGPPTAKAEVDPESPDLLSALKANAPTRRPSALDFVLPDEFRLPGYDLLEPIGRGGMGVVYKARQHGVNRVVAVKMLNRAAENSDDAARFRHEAEVLGRLRHPNIVQVYEVGVADGRPFLVMEYVAGGSLARWAGDKPQPPAVAAGVAEQVARAVQHAHDHGVLHRDLKPANILMSDEQRVVSGESESTTSLTAHGSPLAVVKVTDFGLAKSVNQDVSLTQTGVIVGTPSYMAPEQVAGEALTPACDVYGLGAVLYELLTGRPPFAGANAADVLVQVRFQDPVPPSRVIPTLPRDLNTVCLKCLEKDPRRRYASAAAVADDLRRWRGGEPILARPAGTAERAWKWAKRRPSAAVLVAVALALLFVGLPAATGLAVWADAQRRAADRELERSGRLLYSSNVAQAELNSGLDLTRTRYYLRAAEPAPGQPDRRGWEWFYLNGLAHRELLDLRPPPPDYRDRALYTVAFAPDGDLVAAGGGVRGYTYDTGFEPGELAVWDAATGRPAGGPAYPATIAVTALAFGPEPGRLFTVASDVRQTSRVDLRAWDRGTGTVLFERTFPSPKVLRSAPVSTLLAVDPAGSRLAIQLDAGVVVCEAATGVTVAELAGAVGAGFPVAGNEVTTVLPHPGWTTVTVTDPVTGRETDKNLVAGELRVIDASSGEEVRRTPFTVPRFTLWTVSPAGARAVGVYRDTVAALGPPVSGDATATRAGVPAQDQTAVVLPADGSSPWHFPLRGHVGDVTAAAIDPDDRLLATGGADGTVRVWDLATGQVRHVFHGHTDRVTAVAFDRAGVRVASVGWDRAVKVWDLTRRPEFINLAAPPVGRRRAEEVAFTPDGRELVVVRTPGGQLERWDVATGEQTAARVLDTAGAFAVIGNPRGLYGLTVPGRTAALSAGGRRLAAVAAVDSRVVNTWDTAAATRLAILRGPRAQVRNLALSGDGSRAAAAGWWRNVAQGAEADLFVWDAATGAEKLRIGLDGLTCPGLAFTADGRRLAVATRQNAAAGTRPDPAANRLRVWDVDAGREAREFDCGGGAVRAVAFDEPGGRLAAATDGPRLLIWDAATGRRLHAIECLERYEHLVFAPDGLRLSGATRELVTFWDPATGSEVLTLRGTPRSGIDPPFNPRVVFGPGGAQVAMSQWDFTVDVWTAAGYGEPR